MKKNNYKRVGLIIKNRYLSVVEVEVRNDLPVITNYSKILLEEGIVENDCIILNKESFQEAVKKLLADGVGGPIKTGTLFVSLPEEKIFSHQITILKEKAEDVEYIKEVAADFIPIELDQAVFDYKVVHEDPKGKTVIVNVVATQNGIAQPIIDALREIDLEVTKINVDIYCLIKSFHNCLNQGEGAYLIVNMEPSRDFLAIASTDDQVFKVVSKGMRDEMMDRLKALLGLTNDDELKQLLISTRRGAGITEEQRAILKDSFKDYLEDLSNKIRQLVETTQSEEAIEIKRIYLTGMLSALPGIEEILVSLLPEVPILRNIQFMEIPLEIEEDALEGIGLCLNGSLPDDKNNFNLLPEDRRDEICFKRICPRIILTSTILALLLTLLTVKLGTDAASSYLNYKVSSREIVILNEQTLNPYISALAQQKQAQKQNKDQILLLMNDSVPVSSIIRDLDIHNKDGVTMVSFSYRDLTSAANAEISLKAKIANRDATEKWVTGLQESGHYEKVISPLSNLVGKGERFVNISLEMNKAKALESFENEMQKSLTEEEDDLPSSPQ